MHISEGVLSGPVLLTGGVATIIGLAIGLKKLKDEALVRTGVLSATFFMASLIHLPVGPSSIHLILSGLMGVMLGWAAFPAIFVGLLLQALLFQFGGLTVLGVNSVVIGFPAVICGLAAKPLLKKSHGLIFLLISFACGSLAILGSLLLLYLSMIISGNSLLIFARLFFFANIILMIMEGTITMIILSFLKRMPVEITI